MEILEQLWNTNLSYKGMTVNMLGVPVGSKYKSSSMYPTLSKMHKNGLVKNLDGEWNITSSGKKYFEQNRKILRIFDSPFESKAPKNLIIMFDIPETKRSERSWFRKHLKKFNYIMIQKSVWVGPSPLPKEFIEYVKEIKLVSSVKSFKLAKPYQRK